MTDAKKFLDFAEKELDNFLAVLKEAAELESPTYESKEASDACARFFQKLYEEIGFTITAYPQTGCGDHFIAEYGEGEETIMMLGHYDTVFPIGSVKTTMPWKIENGKIYGPGIFDMKGGLVLAYFAMKALQAYTIPLKKKIIICVNGDEESGSPTSRPLMEEVARKSICALVLEGGKNDKGGVKAGRFGRAVYDFYAHGKDAHSGNEPADAVSAILEFSYLVQELHKLNDFKKVVTVSPTYISSGGPGVAMVPGEGRLSIDVRASTMAAMDTVMAEIEALKPTLKGMELELRGGLNKPVFEFDEKNKALFAIADAAANDLGFSLTPYIVGGGSDGNFTSFAGTPTLDGLGLVGAFMHTQQEQITLDDIVPRIALLARILQTL